MSEPIGDFRQLVKSMTYQERMAIKCFYIESCRRAEKKMLKTNKLEGSHYAAMQEIMKELILL